MDKLDDDLRRALKMRAARAETHPDPELLAAYHAGELTADQESGVQDHLVFCRECTALLLGLEDLVAPATGQPVLRFERPRRLSESPTRWLTALAASLLLATLGLSAWVVRLRGTVAELSEPQVNVVLRDLYLADSPRDAEGASLNEVRAGGGPVTLILHPAQASKHPDYLLVIEKSDGTEVWRRQGLRPSPWDTFTLALPGGFLPPGDYLLRLFGLEGNRRESVEDFPLRILAR